MNSKLLKRIFLLVKHALPRLEILEFHIEATKLALQGMQAEQTAKIAQSAKEPAGRIYAVRIYAGMV